MVVSINIAVAYIVFGNKVHWYVSMLVKCMPYSYNWEKNLLLEEGMKAMHISFSLTGINVLLLFFFFSWGYKQLH